jgi:hypothetical protein
METAGGKETVTVLRRLITYAENVFHLSQGLASLGDKRLQPRIPSVAVVKSGLVLFWTRMPSADTLGRVHAGL